MTPTFYSAEEVADLLGLHVRTVRGYVREGRLPAMKIGKQYRIAAADLESFTGSRPLERGARRVEVTAVVQLEDLSPAHQDRLSTLVLAAVNGPNPGRPLHVHTARDEHHNTLKIVVIGPAAEAARLIDLIATFSEASV
ncbi:helix-turn-helix domain-containing protein [Amycolatopsis jiangsuensis]|uniref:Excisionase family DNA binding protein n=1 Tax=Amycolatopsis jiangsuensis TaxID=1181879 RepID=A0A840J326_9PSEU|nr:helix-turn-helix domain-containing protein [Amycolatopsis jiangsuensis]MBB4687694.1 excisionase family DNA binding protein [Amycolatopsis jiangsuensis]